MPERAITDLTSGQLLARMTVSLLPRSTATARPLGVDDAEDTDAPAVLDPACSHATLLMAVADRFGDHVRLAGQEIQESAAAVAALNLRGNAHDAPYEIHTGDSLLDNRLGGYLGAAAAVVCEPPFDTPQWPSVELTTDPRWEFGIPAPRDGERSARFWLTPSALTRPRSATLTSTSTGWGRSRITAYLPGGDELCRWPLPL